MPDMTGMSTSTIHRVELPRSMKTAHGTLWISRVERLELNRRRPVAQREHNRPLLSRSRPNRQHDRKVTPGPLLHPGVLIAGVAASRKPAAELQQKVEVEKAAVRLVAAGVVKAGVGVAVAGDVDTECGFPGFNASW